MQVWFGSFLFAGFLIPLRDLYWPFKAFYYFMPYGYFVRSYIYVTFTNADWEACDPASAGNSPVCVDSTDPGDIIEGIGRIYALIENEDQVWQDVGIILGLAMFWKILAVAAILISTGKVGKIHNEGVRSSRGESSNSNRGKKEILEENGEEVMDV